MSICATNWAWSLQDITSTEKLILLSYADRAGESMEAWPSKMRLHFDTGLCLNTIDKGLKSLTKKGKIIKTGETKNQVPVYKLIGVIPREETNRNPHKKQPPPKTTPPKNGVSTPPKNDPPTPPKNGIQNHHLNHQRNPKGEDLIFSSFSDFKNYVTVLVSETKKQPLEDLVEEVLYYSEEFKNKRLPIESVKMAIPLIKNGKWKTPHGFKGFSFKSIVEKEESYERKKQEQIIEDGKMARQIKEVIKSGGNYQSLKERLQNYRENLNANPRTMQEKAI